MPNGKIGVFVIHWMGSSRLPRKALLDVGGICSVEWVMQRAKNVVGADVVALCTSEFSENQILCNLAEKNGIESFRGSNEDKVQRISDAADFFDVEFFICFDGEDLFVSEELAGLMISQYRETDADFIYGDNSLIVGSITDGIKRSVINKVCEQKTISAEMLRPFFLEEENEFKVEKLSCVPKIYKRKDIRATMDYYEDLVFFKTIVDQIGKEEFTLRDVIYFLDKNPEIKNINISKNEEWALNQSRLSKQQRGV